jgi:hypothetical protein
MDENQSSYYLCIEKQNEEILKGVQFLWKWEMNTQVVWNPSRVTEPNIQHTH